MRTALILGLAASTALTVPAFAEKPDKPGTTKSSGETKTITCEGGTVSLAGSKVLWPPNHKMVAQTGTAISDPQDVPMGDTALTLYAADVDDVVGGDGNTETDSSIDSTATDMQDGADDRTATVPYEVRAERSGKGDGRTYSIEWKAVFEDGSTCASDDPMDDDPTHVPFTVTVPHDQGQGNDDKS